MCRQLVYLIKRPPTYIHNILDELSLAYSLDETYECALQDIAPANWVYIRRLLQCVTVAFRPLHIEELAEFYAFDFRAEPIPQFHEDWRSRYPLDGKLSSYSSLFSVVDINKASIVQFPHASLKDFLVSNSFGEKCDFISTNYHISMIDAHSLVARASLSILLHLEFNITRHSLAKFLLAKYAAQYWVDHAQFGGVLHTMEEGIKQLFDPRKVHFTIWTWVYDPIQPRKQCEPGGRPFPSTSTRNPLHYATFLGLTAIVEFPIIELSQDVDS